VGHHQHGRRVAAYCIERVCLSACLSAGYLISFSCQIEAEESRVASTYVPQIRETLNLVKRKEEATQLNSTQRACTDAGVNT